MSLGGTRYRVAPIAKAGINAANSVMWELRAPTQLRPCVVEIGIFIVTVPTTAPNFVLARTTALAVTPTNIPPLPCDPGEPAALSGFAAAWVTAPTFTTAGPFLAQSAIPLTAGQGFIWTFPEGIILPVGAGATSGLVIANTVASGATLGSFSMYMVFQE